MVKMEGFASRAVEAAGDALLFPVRHPGEVAKTVGLGGLAVAGTALVTQMSMLAAEGGLSRDKTAREDVLNG